MRNMSFALPLLVASVAAHAAEVLDVTIANPPTFQYETATSVSPLIVEARTENGNCKLTLALVGLQGGVWKDGGTVTGRVESGLCDGRPVNTKTIVSGFAIRSGEKVKLLPTASVVLLKP